MSKTVTVLTALYKAGLYIEAKIENLRQQTIFEQCDFVLLNCQNLDNEKDAYTDFLKHDNVREIYYPEYTFLYPTWDEGIKTSDSEFICNSNADDMWDPVYLAKCVDFLQSKEEYSITSSYICMTDVPNQPDCTKWDVRGYFPEATYPDSTAGPCPVWRRSLHSKYGYFGDYATIGDARMWEKWQAGGEKFGLIEEYLVLYYLNPQSLERRWDEDTSRPLRERDLTKDFPESQKKRPIRETRL